MDAYVQRTPMGDFNLSPILLNLLEQWSLTGGRQSSLAISMFFIFSASSTCRRGQNNQVIAKTDQKKKRQQQIAALNQLTDFPFTHSVARELEAMADPQPNVLNFASTILPFPSTSTWKKQPIVKTPGSTGGSDRRVGGGRAVAPAQVTCDAPGVSSRRRRPVRPPNRSPRSWRFCRGNPRFLGFHSDPPPSRESQIQ